MTSLSALVPGPASAPPGLTTVAGSGAMKSSILLFDTLAGTRNFPVPVTGKYRVAVVGGGSMDGGGYSEDIFNLTAGATPPYTVGAAGNPGSSAGGTSSFNSAISATGGSSSGGTPGVGSGGKINTSGGVGNTNAGGASGHRFGNGGAGGSAAGSGGGGWSQDGWSGGGGDGGVDGFGLGLIPGKGGVAGISSTNTGTPGGYGAGGGNYPTSGVPTAAGIGGGAVSAALPGIGGGCGSSGKGGKACVIIELIG